MSNALRNRIVGTGEIDPRELKANPRNWRKHPSAQRGAIHHSLERVGWVQGVLLNKTTGNMIDGHLRVEDAIDAGEATVPYTEVELTEAEELEVLATLDPIGAMAETNVDLLATIVDEIGLPEDSPLHDMMQDLLPDDDSERERSEKLAAMDVTVGNPQHKVKRGEVWNVAHHSLVIVSVYDGWKTFTPLLGKGDLLVPYPTPIVPLTEKARKTRLVMVQPDAWLAGHLLDKYVQVNGAEGVGKA